MKTATAWFTGTQDSLNTEKLFNELVEKLGGAPQLVILHCSVGYDYVSVVTQLQNLAPATQLQGGTSSCGVMTQEGFHSVEGNGLGLMGIFDPDGHYGVAGCELGLNPRGAAAEAVREAIIRSGRRGEVPQVVLMTPQAGSEEEILKGIRDVLGPDVLIVGGSAGDNDFSGKAAQFAQDRVFRNAVSLCVMYPSVEISTGFHSGFEPSEKRGRVTRAIGRVIYEIDGRPAQSVYNEWTGGLLDTKRPPDEHPLLQTTLHPLGMIEYYVGSIPFFVIIHPVVITQDGSLSVMCEIAEGDEIYLMQGTCDSMVTRASRVAQAAIAEKRWAASDISGSLVIFCAGCMLTVTDRMHEVVSGLQGQIPAVPFLGTFTFGEQGCFLGDIARHGNIMISVLLFGKKSLV